jgi:hypothetical protein
LGEPWRSSHIDVTENQIIGAGQNSVGSADGDGGGGNGIIVKASDYVALRANVIKDSRGQAVAIYGCENCVND